MDDGIQQKFRTNWMNLLEIMRNRRLSSRPSINSAKSEVPPDTDVPAVAYVRMSTDHQKYSTENQLDAHHPGAGRTAGLTWA
ncbi:hypothetical protein CDV49_09265 [Haematobacter genomosp. 1]|uniref:Resolvase/invertase-type recombinase catalytic domain-containing protein n=1 Tax=Haematobacter genomosp. 1 TaxID=366618 RepID=A0A212ABT5_9RHOB|nr:hypothetical protein CDV49_09265 [Haematobacter genomosp. 1]